MAMAVGMGTDNLIVTRLLSPEAVTQYSIPAKLYGLVTIAIGMGIGPLWPAYGEAIARGDHAWVRSTLLRAMKLATLGAIILAVALSLMLQKLLDIWVGPAIRPSHGLMFALALAAVFESWRISVVMFLNGSGVVAFQLAIDLSFAAVCVAFRLFLVSKIGLTGIPLGSVVAYVLITAIPYSLYLRSRMRGDLMLK
jgi:O-antigen/teichoic acid export membrane protein